MTPTPPPVGQKKSNTALYVVIGLVVAMGCCGVFGILAAIAIPNFIKFQARAKQSECKVTLKTAYVAQKSYYAEYDKYAADAATMGFVPDLKRYALIVSPGNVELPQDPAAQSRGLVEATPAAVRQSLGIRGECPDCQVTMACVGNVDGDPTVDVWSISTDERVIDGVSVPPGQVFQHVDDLVD